ncbi:hypothetical protein QT06_C0001G1349 [archaeon GW2011_AR15]|nr:hypothetical protein QT06_C0001G1349 [archaeon GW2011_AR15]
MDVPNNAQIKRDFEAMQKISKAIKKVIVKIGDISIIKEELAPEGLKPLARSVSWLVEQIMVQNIRKYKDELGIEKVEDPPSNVSLYDCSIKFRGESKIYYLNLKTSSAGAKKTKDDISKADKLIELYQSDSDYTLFVAVLKVIFKNTHLILNHENNLIIFNIAWIPDIYCNPRNNNLQSSEYDQTQFRTNQEFLQQIKAHYKVSVEKKRNQVSQTTLES